jgi:hypothetical protein
MRNLTSMLDRVSFHDNALALGREARARVRAQEAEREAWKCARISADLEAAKKAITVWMTEIGMAPLPKFSCEHRGDVPWYSDSDPPPDLGRSVQITWVFDNHRYKADYDTNGRIYSISMEITVNYPKNPHQFREIRGPNKYSQSVELDKVRIGQALLEEKEPVWPGPRSS